MRTNINYVFGPNWDKCITAYALCEATDFWYLCFHWAFFVLQTLIILLPGSCNCLCMRREQALKYFFNQVNRTYIPIDY